MAERCTLGVLGYLPAIRRDMSMGRMQLPSGCGGGAAWARFGSTITGLR